MRIKRRVNLVLTGLADWLGIGPPQQNFLSGVGVLRYIQATREPDADRNPDHAVGALLSSFDKVKARYRDISWLRNDRFYRYLRFRTIHYDRIVENFIQNGGRQIVILGVGTDTRTLRYNEQLRENGARVIEADLEPWISRRRRYMKKLGAEALTFQLAFDLENDDISELLRLGGGNPSSRTLIFAEGVLTYISPSAAKQLLKRVGEVFSGDTLLAFDVKKRGKNENGSFRPSDEEKALVALHTEAGLTVHRIIPSAELHVELGFPEGYPKPHFDEDILLIAGTEGKT